MTHDTGNSRVEAEETEARLRTIVVLCGVQFVDVLGVTVVITALPQLLTDLGATPLQGTFVVTAYAMAFGGLLMVASRVGDRVGHRRIVLGSLVLFGAAAALGAAAATIWLLAGARALQGAAAAASVPAALRLLTTLVPDGVARRRAVAGWSAAGAAAGATGFVLGGVLTQASSWRSVFVMFVALAALLVLGIAVSVPRDRPGSARVRIPWLSGLLLTGSAMGVVAGSTLFADAGARALGGAVTVAGVAAALGLVLVEKGASTSLVPPAARTAAALHWGALGSLGNTATTSGSFTVAMLYLQGELGLAPLRAAALLLPFSLMVVAGAAASPRLMARAGWGHALGCGLGMIGVGNTVLVVWPGAVGVAVAAAISGTGIGVGSVAATDMGTHVPDAVKAAAAGVLNTAAQLGTALGTALAVVLAASLEPRTAWALAAGLAATGGVAAARFAPRDAGTPQR